MKGPSWCSKQLRALWPRVPIWSIVFFPSRKRNHALRGSKLDERSSSFQQCPGSTLQHLPANISWLRAQSKGMRKRLKEYRIHQRLWILFCMRARSVSSFHAKSKEDVIRCVCVWVCGCVGVCVCGCVGVWVCLSSMGHKLQQVSDTSAPNRGEKHPKIPSSSARLNAAVGGGGPSLVWKHISLNSTVSSVVQLSSSVLTSQLSTKFGNANLGCQQSSVGHCSFMGVPHGFR